MLVRVVCTLTSIIFCWRTMTEENNNKSEVNFPNLEDELLIHHIQQRRDGAFAVLVNRHAKRFYSIAYRLVFDRDDAEDIVQEAFLKLWDRPKLWDQSKQAKFTTWFYKVVTNLCLDHNRKQRPSTLPEDIQLVDIQPGQEVLLNQQQRQALLDNFIQELPGRQQLALNLCFYEGLSNKEAAEIMGVRVKALQSLIMRAKTTLKEKIKQYLD